MDDPIAVKERHERFVRRILETKTVWALDKENKILAAAECSRPENSGRRVVPFWSEEAYARQCAREHWSEYRPKTFALGEFLEDLLLHLEKNNFLAGTDWNSHLIGTELDPSELAKEIKSLM